MSSRKEPFSKTARTTSLLHPRLCRLRRALDDVRIYNRALSANEVAQLAGHPNPFNVPGTANPWLAGLPNGSTAMGGQGCTLDVAPAQSPVLFDSVIPGTVIKFTATGSTDHGGPPFGSSPDGDVLQAHIAENGIASNNVPISSLVGVFLDDSRPDSTAAPNPFAYQPSASISKPGLKQVFFIGDGLTGTSNGT